jgi:transcriptional regulator
MYIPPKFSITDLAELHTLMQSQDFGTLITQSESGPQISHLPLITHTDRGPYGTIEGHFARANSHWQELAQGKEVLIIFNGPHTYISPSWYESPERQVPTWNFAVVHAYGRARLIEDERKLYELLVRQVTTYEQYRPEPWQLAMSIEEVGAQLRAIIGFEIEITRLEGKFKISQNRSKTDQRRVYQQLSQSDNQQALHIAELMKRLTVTEE